MLFISLIVFLFLVPISFLEEIFNKNNKLPRTQKTPSLSKIFLDKNIAIL
jgi:hypothetical protein